MLNKKIVGHQLLHAMQIRVILAGNLFLLSDYSVLIANLCAYRLYEIGPCANHFGKFTSALEKEVYSFKDPEDLTS